MQYLSLPDNRSVTLTLNSLPQAMLTYWDAAARRTRTVSKAADAPQGVTLVTRYACEVLTQDGDAYAWDMPASVYAALHDAGAVSVGTTFDVFKSASGGRTSYAVTGIRPYSAHATPDADVVALLEQAIATLKHVCALLKLKE